MPDRKDLTRRTMLYLLAQIFSKLTNLLIIPLFVIYLSQKSYGIVNISYIYISFLGLLMISGMNEAFIRFYTRAKVKRLKGMIITSIFLITTVIGIVLISVQLLIDDTLATLLFDSPDYKKLILFILAIGLIDSWNQLTLVLHISEKNIKRYTITLLLKMILNLLFNVYFLIFLELKVEGVLLSFFLSSLISTLFNAKYIRERSHFEINKRLLIIIMRYGFPFLLTSISVQLLFQVDQILLKFLISLEAVAVYGVAYKIGSSIQYISNSFTNAWFPHLFSMKIRDINKEISKMFLNYIFYLLPFLTALTAGNFYILPLFIPTEYSQVISIIPWILWGYFLFGLFDFFSAVLRIKLESRKISLITTYGALLNILLNLLFIKIFGIIGAAVVTFISFLFILILTYYYSNRLFKVNYEFSKLFKPGFIYGVLLLISIFFSFSDQVTNVIFGALFIIFIISSPFLFGFLSFKQIKTLFR